MTAKPFYIYKLISSIDRKPFYVGKGCGKRMYDHYAKRTHRSTTSSHTNELLKNKINKLVESGGHIVYHSRHVANEAVAFDLERRLIAKYGRRDIKTGILCNMTNGGEGVSGYRRTEQWRKQCSEQQRAKARPIDQYTKDGAFIRTWLHYKEACAATGADASGITRCCNQKLISAGGFRWTWSGDRLQDIVRRKRGPGRRYGVPVYQFALDGTYVAKHDSLILAGKAVGKHANTILECCKLRSNTAGGFRWSYKQDIIPTTTGTVFQYNLSGMFIRNHITHKSASIASGIEVDYIQRALRDGSTAGGFYWTNGNVPELKQKVTTGKPIQQLTKDGTVVATFPSTRQAIIKTGIKGISNCVSGLAKTAGGFAWQSA